MGSAGHSQVGHPFPSATRRQGIHADALLYAATIINQVVIRGPAVVRAHRLCVHLLDSERGWDDNNLFFIAKINYERTDAYGRR